MNDADLERVVVWGELVENAMRFVYPDGKAGGGLDPAGSAQRLYAWCRRGPAVRDAASVLVRLRCSYDPSETDEKDAAAAAAAAGGTTATAAATDDLDGGGVGGGGGGGIDADNVSALLHLEKGACWVEEEVLTGAQPGAVVGLRVPLSAHRGSASAQATAERAAAQLLADCSRGRGGVVCAAGLSVVGVRLLSYESSEEACAYRLPAWRRQHGASGPALPYEEGCSVSREADQFVFDLYCSGKAGRGGRPTGKAAAAAAAADGGAAAGGTSLFTDAEISALKVGRNAHVDLALRFTPLEISHILKQASEKWGVDARESGCTGFLSLPECAHEEHSCGRPTVQETLCATLGRPGASTKDDMTRELATVRGSMSRSGTRSCGSGGGGGSPPSPDGGGGSGGGSDRAWQRFERLLAGMSVRERKRLAQVRQGMFSSIADAALRERARRLGALRAAAPQAGNRRGGEGVRLDKTVTMPRQLGSYNTSLLTGMGIMERSGAAAGCSTGAEVQHTRLLHQNICGITSVVRDGPPPAAADLNLNCQLLRPAHPTKKPFLAGWDPYCCTRGTGLAGTVMGIPPCSRK